MIRRPKLVLVLLCSTQFLNVVALSSVNIALPDIAADLGLSVAGRSWIVAAYALAFGGFLLVGGRVADLVGRRKVLIVGFAVFAACALLDALATSPEMLIGARALQGLGAAIAIPASLGILTNIFAEGGERSRAVAAFGAAGAVGFACGLILGGLITDTLGWRWVFGLTAPVTVAVLGLVVALVPRDPPDGHADGGVDLVGAFTAAAGLLGLGFGFNRAAEIGWGAPPTLLAVASGCALLIAFIYSQARRPEPLMPLRLWKLPNFTAVMAIGFCAYAAWTGMTFFLALTLQEVLGYSATEAALALLPLAVGAYLGSTLAGRLLPRTGPKPLLVAGLALFASGLALTATIDAEAAYWPQIFLAISANALGLSMTFVSANVTALADAELEEESLVGGLFATVAQGVGGGLGLALLSAVVVARIDPGASEAALLPGYQAAFWAATSITLVALAVAVLAVRRS